MAFLRAAALRSSFRAVRQTIARPQLRCQIGRRGYASGGHEAAKAGGDAVWAAGAVAVTVPTTWWILQSAPAAADHGDGHGAGHGGHSKSHGEEEESKDEAKVEEKSDGAESEEEASESEKSEDSANDDEVKDTPETSDDEAGDESQDEDQSDKEEENAASKPAGSQNEQSGKQEGVSNADTKHPTDVVKDGEQSSKGEGTPETSKTKGAVDPKRPQA